ncbi:unnamed protein product [Aureobasidium vineae]|uniref:Uncharacterized protein n=1 Tax=Aureobasidium vineae TaxID=2773715 RepID=A0A9N8JM00_9PEZI|nr:unnamed protein product [Aureobasidium vineae]
MSATACFVFLEDDHEVALTWDHVPMLCLNLTTTAITIALLPSILGQTKEVTMLSITFFTAAGFTAFFSQQLWLPVYLSYVQVLAFLISLACCAVGRLDRPNHDYSSEQGWLELPTESGNITKLSNPSMAKLVSKVSKRMRWVLHQMMIQLVLLSIATAAWGWFLTTNLSTQLAKHTSHDLRLDTSYKANSNIDIVMSMYREHPSHITQTLSLLNSIPSIGSKSPRLVLYTKDPHANTALLQQQTNATKVIQLPNVGREGHTYLHHITSSWDDLATQTFFLQASIHNPREFSARVEDYYTPQTGMLGLGFSDQSCECNNCGDRFGWQDHSGIVEETWKEVFNQTCGEQRVLLSYKGQFVASAARLRANKKSLYERLMKALEEPGSWAHQQKYLQGRPDSLNAPYFGYTLERLWSVILQCSGERIAALCPTLLSGTRRNGSKADCQCLDSSWKSIITF